MKKPEIVNMLRNNHMQFIEYVAQLSQENFMADYNEKWTAGQHLQHIILSIKPLNNGLMLPAFLLKIIFGKANRHSKTYEELVAKYKLKLREGGRATAAFIPPVIQLAQKGNLLDQVKKRIEKLCRQVEKFTELQLDNIIAPHPLLGKVTLREMLYFTMYHVNHHQELLQKNLASSQS